jgi:hypothetical protein
MAVRLLILIPQGFRRHPPMMTIKIAGNATLQDLWADASLKGFGNT